MVEVDPTVQDICDFWIQIWAEEKEYKSDEPLVNRQKLTKSP